MWKTFREDCPDSGDTVIVMDPENDEMGVFIYCEAYPDVYLSLAGSVERHDISIDPEWLWMNCPKPYIYKGTFIDKMDGRY